jgi:hypothetical protein
LWKWKHSSSLFGCVCIPSRVNFTWTPQRNFIRFCDIERQVHAIYLNCCNFLKTWCNRRWDWMQGRASFRWFYFQPNWPEVFLHLSFAISNAICKFWDYYRSFSWETV